MIKAALFLSFFFVSLGVFGNTIIVTNKLDSGAGSLRNAIFIAADGDTIRFDNSLIALSSDSIVVLTEILFSKSLVIKGLYNSTDTLKISGGMTTRIFHQLNATRIVFDSLVLVNCYGAGGGGAIRCDKIDSIFVLNSVIYNNTTNGAGGAIYSSAYYSSGFHENTIIVTNTQLSNNSAFGIGFGSGGAIYINSAHTYNYLTFSNSKIESNFAAGHGGAIAVNDVNSVWSYLTITDSEIHHNSSTLNGGGIFMKSQQNGAIEFDQNNTSIYNNIASGNGGGIYVSAKTSVTLSIDYSAVYNNVAQNGGGIYCDRFSVTSATASANLNLTYTSIYTNNASVNGGGIYLECTSTNSGVNATINALKSTLAYNVATSFGGGIYTKNTNASSNIYSTFNLTNVSILHNLAPSGGGIYTSSQSNVGNEYSNIIPKGSIIAFNGLNNINNSQLPTIVSSGFNIFDNLTLTGSIASDILAASLVNVNLGPLQNNGGFAETMAPFPTSIAVDSGNPADVSDAQNIPIVGIRDRGAAEYTCNSYSLQNITACDSFSTASGQILSQSGSYFDTIPNINGCDSIITYNLTIPTKLYDTTFYVICSGDSVLFYNQYYQTSGIQTDTLSSLDGCDSIIYVLNLTVKSYLEITIDTMVCNSYTSPTGINFTNSGIFYDTLSFTNSCDSIRFTINLTVLHSNSSTIDTTVCDTYTSPSGNIYSNTGTYLDNLTNQSGCDSTITVNLTVIDMNPSIIDNGNYLSANYTTGDLYEWIDCNTDLVIFTGLDFYFSSGGSYKVKITSNGCEETSSCYSFSHAGIIQNNLDNLVIYPNPTSTILSIDGVKVEKIVIIGLDGLEILISSNTNTIDVSNLVSGCYFIEINNGVRKLFSKQ